MTLKSSYDGYSIAEKDLAMRGPGDFLKAGADGAIRQSGGVRFRLGELCDDTGLMSIAFSEARALAQTDPELCAHPALKAEVQSMFNTDPMAVN